MLEMIFAATDAATQISDKVFLGLIGLTGTFITVIGTVIVAMLNRQGKRQQAIEKTLKFNGGDTDSVSDRLDRMGSRFDKFADRMDLKMDNLAGRVDQVSTTQTVTDQNVSDIASDVRKLRRRFDDHMQDSPAAG